ncbi:MAG: Rdx family protein [Candidatus Nanohaloarchaea archaeon]
MDLTIDYCEDCGYLDKAVEIAREVLQENADRLDSVELVPADSDVLRVSVESEVVFDIDEEDYSAEAIEQKVSDRIEQPVE